MFTAKINIKIKVECVLSYNYLKSNLEYAILQYCYNIKNQTRK